MKAAWKHLFSLSALGLGLACACGSSTRLAERVQVLEEEMNDLRRTQRATHQRLDEIQIQTSLLLKKMATGPVELDSTKVELPLVAGATEKKDKALPLLTNKKGRKKGLRKKRAKPVLVPVEPHEVSERLPVGLSPRASVTLDDDDDEEAQGGYDEEGVSKELALAKKSFGQGRFSEAQRLLREFVRKYPEHHLNPDARYALGQTRFALGDYRGAQVDFLIVSRQHPNSTHAAGAMLMAARSQEKLGRRGNARSLYLQLVQAHPLSGEAAEANRRLNLIR